jgi:N-acetylglucosaminyldiphosphoundecaprenol N-acetyl-beta-D-mannosaminyltransferase
MIGVGAAFDFHAGLKKQAPAWMQQSGLEWFFRLATEPRRLWKRYLYNNPAFVWLALQELWRSGVVEPRLKDAAVARAAATPPRGTVA